MRYIIILGCILWALQAQAQTGFETALPTLHFKTDTYTCLPFNQPLAPRPLAFRKPVRHQYPAVLRIIDPPPRREYIIKNGPEKKLYYNDGNRIIETCIGPVGMSCSFYLW